MPKLKIVSNLLFQNHPNWPGPFLWYKKCATKNCIEVIKSSFNKNYVHTYLEFHLEKADFFPYWVVNFPQDWTQWVRESPAVPHSWRKLFSFLKLCYYACVIDTPINIKHIAPHYRFNVLFNSHLNNSIFFFWYQSIITDFANIFGTVFFFDNIF